MTITQNQTNFTSGEISPILSGRTDVARYLNGAKEITNAVPLIYGGAKRRDGTRFVAEALPAASAVRIIRYVFNRDQSYLLIIGGGMMRICKDGSLIAGADGGPYQIEVPWSDEDLSAITFAQSGDSMFLAHRSYHPQRLRRYAHDFWVLADAPFVAYPVSEIGTTMNEPLTLSSAGEGVLRTFTSVGFIGGDVGRHISERGGGLARITGFSSPTVVQATIIKEFSSASVNAGEWTIDGSPQLALTPSAANPVGAIIDLTASGTVGIGTTYAVAQVWNDSNNDTFIRTATAHGLSAGATFILAGMVCSDATAPDKYNRGYTVSSVPSPDVIRLAARVYYYGGLPGFAGAGSASSPQIWTGDLIGLGSLYGSNVTGGAAAWRPTDVGAVVKINGGAARITKFKSPLVVEASIESSMTSIVTAIKNAWSLEYPVWNAGDYPGAVSIYEQRLIFGGSHSFPSSVWMSVIGEYLNFVAGTQDSDGLSLTVASDEVADIRHLSQTKALIALSSGGEFTFFGGVEKPITPTNVQVKNQSPYGCSQVRPARIGNELYFMQRAGRKLRAMAYKFDSDSFGAPDLSVFGEHLTEGGVVDMAYQQEPLSVLWVLRADGVLTSVTIDRDQDVVAWARHDLGGIVESVASIPADGRDDLYIVVRREVNGVQVRYVERMDESAGMDASITGAVDVPTAVWGGLDHLEGKEVLIRADDSMVTPRVVSGGQVTLERAVSDVEIGLAFTPRIVALTPEMVGQTGSSQGKAMSAREVTLRVHETKGLRVNGQEVAFRRLVPGNLDVPVEPFTGLKKIECSGWDRGKNEITVEGIPGEPFHLLGIIRELQVQGG